LADIGADLSGYTRLLQTFFAYTVNPSHGRNLYSH